MRFFTRLLGCVATALVLSTVLLSFASSWFGDKGSALRLCRSLLFETRRSQALSEQAEIVSDSMHIKRTIILQLLAGRMDLREAIARFQEANERIGNENLHLVAEYRKPTDLEGTGRQVLAWAEIEVASWPAEKDKRILQTVEKDFQKMFGTPQRPVSENRSREPSASPEVGSIRGAD